MNYPQLWSLHREGSDDLRISRNDGKQGKSIAGRLPYRYVIASWQQAMQVAALCHYALLVSGPEGERCSGLLIPDTDLGENPRRERGV
ncbi:hypothetical protein ACSLV1_25405, partial [Pseudomonas aeruginosa]|uniref:hypothetical protein n=1 Tax=Pseudomonas aeruginosa TaxID=287 RepID=UPI003F19DF8E